MDTSFSQSGTHSFFCIKKKLKQSSWEMRRKLCGYIIFKKIRKRKTIPASMICKNTSEKAAIVKCVLPVRTICIKHRPWMIETERMLLMAGILISITNKVCGLCLFLHFMSWIRLCESISSPKIHKFMCHAQVNLIVLLKMHIILFIISNQGNKILYSSKKFFRNINQSNKITILVIGIRIDPPKWFAREFI